MNYGYFDSPTQIDPKFDPGLDVSCPVCGGMLVEPVKTISIMVPTSDRSYFYRTHKQCYDGLDDAGKSRVDGLIVDMVVSARNVN